MYNNPRKSINTHKLYTYRSEAMLEVCWCGLWTPSLGEPFESACSSWVRQSPCAPSSTLRHPGAHHQGFRPGVVPSQPQEHHQYPHVQCIAKSMRLAHAGPRRAEQRLQLRTCSCNGYDGDRVYQRPQVTLSNLPINLRIYSLHLKILTIFTCSCIS